MVKNKLKMPNEIKPINEFFEKMIAIGIIAKSTGTESSQFHRFARQCILLVLQRWTNLCILITTLWNFQAKLQCRSMTQNQKYAPEEAQSELKNGISITELLVLFANIDAYRTLENEQNIRPLWNILSEREGKCPFNPPYRNSRKHQTSLRQWRYHQYKVDCEQLLGHIPTL